MSNIEVIGLPNGDAPLSVTLTQLGLVDLQSLFARFDGTNAAGPFRPTLTVRAQNGAIITRTFPPDDLDAGDIADMTFAPLMSSASEVPATSVVSRFAIVDVAAAGDTDIVAAVPGRAIRVTSCVLISAGTPTVQWFSDSSSGTPLSGPIDLTNTPGYAPGDGMYGQTDPGEALILNVDSTDPVGGVVGYVLV